MENDHVALTGWCEGKTEKQIPPLLIGSILAGAYIGFASQLFTLVTASSGLPFGINQLIGGLVFSVGLIFVVLGKAELFTGNNLISYSCYSSKLSVYKMLKNWGIVYLGNFIGALVLVGLYHGSGLLASSQGIIAERAVMIASTKINLPFFSAFSRGILCNWLVCLAVLLCIFSENNLTKLLIIPAPILTFVALGYEHSVANMYFLPAGIIAQKYGEFESLLGWGSLFRNLVPVTLGNIIGGALFVGFFYWVMLGRTTKRTNNN